MTVSTFCYPETTAEEAITEIRKLCESHQRGMISRRKPTHIIIGRGIAMMMVERDGLKFPLGDVSTIDGILLCVDDGHPYKVEVI